MSTQVKINKSNQSILSRNNDGCACICDYSLIFIRESRVEKIKSYKAMLNKIFNHSK